MTDPAASGRTFVMYPPDENITVKITMGASVGESFNGKDGGNGGVTIFTYTLQKNTEYAFKLGYSFTTNISWIWWIRCIFL